MSRGSDVSSSAESEFQLRAANVTTVIPITANSHIKIPLCASDYPSWKAYVTALLNGFDLAHYVDDSIPPPPVTDPGYNTWFQQDQLLLAAFIGSAEPKVRRLISSATSAAKAWRSLNDHFSGPPDMLRSKVPCISQEDFIKLLQPDSDQRSTPNRSPATRRQMHKVPHRLRLTKSQNDSLVYDPVMVSLGPYHHGRPELRQAQEFKNLCLNWCAEGDNINKTRLYNRVLGRIDEIRGCYADVSVLDKFDDKVLALMMLLDSCFVFNFIENRTGKKNNNWHNRLGVAASIPFAARDMMLIENQIPFFVLMMLIDAKYDKEAGRELIQKFLSWMLSVDFKQASIPRQDVDPPFHILEASWRVVAEMALEPDSTNGGCGCRWFNLLRVQNDDGSNNMEEGRLKSKSSYHTCPSVTDLKAKGIFFRPSSTHSIKDINFKSYWLFGRLQLPVRSLSDQTQVILSNMIAYEVSPDAKTNLAVLSYTNFMKSLIESPADVRELLDKGIFEFNRLANLEQVVKLFKSFDTFGLENSDIYEDVMQSVGDHCNSRGKTWISQLVNGKLRNPWTLTALLTATLLLVLTFMQTYFTMNPV